MTQGGISFVCRCRRLLQRAVDANTFEALRYANKPLATSRKKLLVFKDHSGLDTENLYF